jgi:hypothetical protein
MQEPENAIHIDVCVDEGDERAHRRQTAELVCDGFDARFAPGEAFDFEFVAPSLDQWLVHDWIDADVVRARLERKERGGAPVRAVTHVQHAQWLTRMNERSQMLER